MPVQKGILPAFLALKKIKQTIKSFKNIFLTFSTAKVRRIFSFHNT